MTHEIEAKFQITSPEVFDRIRTQKQVSGFPLTDQKMTMQQDTYLDTPTGLFFRQGASLRLREKNGIYLVTFKSQIKGNLVRTELEMPITAPQTRDLLNGNLANVHVEAVQAAVSHRAAEPVSPVLYIENTRETWSLNSEVGRVKLCFDNVHYTTPGQNQCQYVEEQELELELQEGDETFLQELTQGLSQQYELIKNTQSKYERGVALLNVFTTE